MGKSSPKQPTPPDPRATAAAQQQMNRQTAIAQSQLNQYDEYTPYGSSVYSPTGQVTSAGIQRMRRDTTLDPAQARILQQQNKVNEELNRVAAKQVGRVGKTLAKPFNYQGMAPGGSASGVSKTVNNLRDMTNNPYDLQAGKPLAPTAQGIADAADRAAMSVDSPFDYSSAPARPEADAAARQQRCVSICAECCNTSGRCRAVPPVWHRRSGKGRCYCRGQLFAGIANV